MKGALTINSLNVFNSSLVFIAGAIGLVLFYIENVYMYDALV